MRRTLVALMVTWALVLGACGDDDSDDTETDDTESPQSPTEPDSEPEEPSEPEQPTEPEAPTEPEVDDTESDDIAGAVAQSYNEIASACPDGMAPGAVDDVTVEVVSEGSDGAAGSASSTWGPTPVEWTYGFADGSVEWASDICAGRDVSGS